MKAQIQTRMAKAQDADPGLCLVRMIRWPFLLRWCMTIALLVHLELRPVSAASDAMVPFFAEGRISTKSLARERLIVNHTTEADFSFLYSNGWWQVEISSLNTDNGVRTIQNCMKIPDGTRSYTQFEGSQNTGPTGAEACPTAFPQPGKTELFVTWLSLCPHPQLPLIDARRMRRFINLPICRPDIFNQPRNEGGYQLQYLNPGNAFLSKLDVMNNGFTIDVAVQQNGDIAGEAAQFPAPFEKGFKDLRYQILESTNINGIAFPLRTVYERYAPDFENGDPDNPRVALSTELIVTRVTFQDAPNRIVAPSPLFAFDARPAGLPKQVKVSYQVFDDCWKSPSDPEIALVVRRAKEDADRDAATPP